MIPVQLLPGLLEIQGLPLALPGLCTQLRLRSVVHSLHLGELRLAITKNGPRLGKLARGIDELLALLLHGGFKRLPGPFKAFLFCLGLVDSFLDLLLVLCFLLRHLALQTVALDLQLPQGLPVGLEVVLALLKRQANLLVLCLNLPELALLQPLLLREAVKPLLCLSFLVLERAGHVLEGLCVVGLHGLKGLTEALLLTLEL
mmetsp:Transcript_5768/g.17373  ORF Transcript_5768/g.17373 Transcript_5768/m.17373 type:complete len:202 (+) Transcript_5768:1446-2051(+)